jgi:transposase
VEVELEKIEYTRKKRKGKREEDLSSLPIRQIVYELPEDERGCPTCEVPMKDSGTMTRREIEIIPATAVVVEHITHSYACNNPMCAGTLPKNPNVKECQDPSGDDQGGDQVVVSAVSPTPLFQGSLASPSFVAHIVYQKYSNGMPLYRLEKGFLV